jgi:hypothetical protein
MLTGEINGGKIRKRPAVGIVACLTLGKDHPGTLEELNQAQITLYQA